MPGARLLWLRTASSLPRALAGAALAVLVAAAGGCAFTVGRLAAVSTRIVEPDVLVSDAPARHAIGRSCLHLFIAIPTRLPNFGEAIDAALHSAGAAVLTDAVIRYEMFYVPLLYGKICYVAEGEAR